MTETRKELIQSLKQKAKQMRKLIVETAGRAGSAHVPSAFSATEMVTALYFNIMKYDASNPLWEDRDRFILSAGHKCLVQYAALTLAGVMTHEDICTFDCYESFLGGHPIYGKCPGIEASTGALGHGLNIGAGMAYAGKFDKKDYRVFVILGDGECHEGTIWEAAMAGSKYELDNLIAIVDYNKMSATFPLEAAMPVEPFADKWRSFGWSCQEINGNDMEEVVSALQALPFEQGKPSAILSHTVKGHGVSFIVNQPMWHYAKWNPEDINKALAEIEIAV